MTSARHEAIVNGLLDGGASKHFFRRAARAAIAGVYFDGMVEVPNRVPDAYRIKCEDGKTTIQVFEVEVTNVLATKKLREYADFWFAIDAYNPMALDFELYSVDSTGHAYQIDLCSIWYAELFSKAHPSRHEISRRVLTAI